VAVYSEADRGSLHVRNAEQAVLIGGAAAADSYLRSDRILEAAIATGAQAIHPGYGFLSENAQFAQTANAPASPSSVRRRADPRLRAEAHGARELAAANGAAAAAGQRAAARSAAGAAEAQRIGYPVMLKSTAGGGGIGMQQCASEAELSAAFDSVRRIAGSNFRDSGVFLEKYLARARHIEVQLFGDGAARDRARRARLLDAAAQPEGDRGDAGAGPERAPAHAAVRGGGAARQAVHYRSAGTVEFIVDADRGQR
jgi:urea carboxylase